MSFLCFFRFLDFLEIIILITPKNVRNSYLIFAELMDGSLANELVSQKNPLSIETIARYAIQVRSFDCCFLYKIKSLKKPTWTQIDFFGSCSFAFFESGSPWSQIRKCTRSSFNRWLFTFEIGKFGEFSLLIFKYQSKSNIISQTQI